MSEQDRTLHERVAVLEIQMEDLKEIKSKLDELIQLKSQGMGALTLVGIILGSGAIGLIMMVVNFFKQGHL